MKEIKLRELEKRTLAIAKGNTIKEQESGQYKPPEKYDDEAGHAPKDKRIKALYSRYQDVGPTETDAKLWEKAQGNRTKGSYRTTDEVELKHTKQYDLALNNGINFVKQEVLKGMKLKEKMRKF